MTTTEHAPVSTSLAAWGRAIDRSIRDRDQVTATRLAEVVFRRLPRHLPTYLRMLDLCWAQQLWSAGDQWARRLLQADPGNPLAWRALAAAAEAQDQRAEANVIWQRAFEMSPYDAEIRSGLNRTRLEPQEAMSYNLACLSALYLCGRRWQHAADGYRTLAQADRRRVDFQVCLSVALWLSGQEDEAYALARHLIDQHPHLIMAWRVLSATGDENDQALAASPLAIMDPDGEYAASVWGVGKQDAGVTVLVTQEEVDLLMAYRYADPGA